MSENKKKRVVELLEQSLKSKDPELYLSRCGLTDKDFEKNSEINKLLRKCTHLRTLRLNHNQIKKIQGLDTLVGLQTIYLSNNQIITLDGIELLVGLQAIDLAYNQITSIRHLLPFLQRKEKPLRIVWRTANDRRDSIPAGWGEINIEGMSISEPPLETIHQGSEAIINYYNELDKQGSEYLYEAKMLIVGQPRAGKTSLRYKLYDIAAKLPDEDETTRGIDIQQLQFDIKDVNGDSRVFKYNVWDFGGQQIYHTTHQFFLTQRSLYVLVMDTGKDSLGNDDGIINYWLQAVELLGGNSPLLLLRNEKNERHIYIDMPKKRERFVFLSGDYSIDLNALISGTKQYIPERVKEFGQLKDDIENQLKHLPLVGFPMPKNWVNIRNELFDVAKTNPYISKEKYVEICRRFEVVEYERQMELSQLFHDLGIFLHFQHYRRLEDFIILQNVWATDAVFAVLDNKKVQSTNGRFTDINLSDIWQQKGYPKEVHRKLLALMEQFELCYEVDKGKHEYIVPEMLPDKAPESYLWSVHNDLPLHYRYDFMPRGLLTRLIVRLNRHIYVDSDQQSVWKTGLKIDGNSLDCPNTFAEITEAWDNKQLLVRIHGAFSKELMSRLTQEIDMLNNDYFRQLEDSRNTQRSKWYKMIPCNCTECRNTDKKYFFEYQKLLKMKERAILKDRCGQEPFEEVLIQDLLEGVFSRQVDEKIISPKNVIRKVKKIFISYSHEDEEWKDEIGKHLSTLKNQDLINDWTDKKIEAGLWDPQIEEAMESSDIFLLLVTHNFLSSQYITTKEITTAYRLFKKGKATIFPIICDNCEWQLQPVTKKEKKFHPVEEKDMYIWLGLFLSFPRNGKPIKNWPNPQDGFVSVIKELKKHL
jgi:internalin A